MFDTLVESINQERDECRKQIRDLQEQLIEAKGLLSTMTNLVLIKYGNTDKEIYGEIEKAVKILTN